MDSEQYRNLMWHVRYVESLLEHITTTTTVWGGVNALYANQNSPYISRSVIRRVRMRSARIANRLSGIGRCGF